jgi:hypothetical protein
MPAGQFLDSMPSSLFIFAHVAFLAAGVWCVRRVRSPAIWLYPISQIGFLAFFAGGSTLKLAVLIEQMLVFALVILVARASPVQGGLQTGGRP